MKGVAEIAGDQAGVDAFVQARGAALSRTAYVLTGDHHLAQDLLDAEVDAPAGSILEGRHLVLMTSPDQPESESI